MTPNIQRRIGSREAHRVFKSIPIGHQRGGGQDAPLVGFDDACIHVWGETEVVGICDKPLQGS